MVKTRQKIAVCQICNKRALASEMMQGGALRQAIVAEIKKTHPKWKNSGYICNDDLDKYRVQYVQNSLQNEKGELSELEQTVLNSMQEQETLSKNINNEFDSNLTFGQRVADKVAEFGGSWNFIILFCCFLALWTVGNSYLVFHLFHKNPFDPFPYILLNLLLSGVAGLQAPVIMMSQNRQEAKDRLRSEHDYVVNLKAELEIRNLHEKMDHLLNQQWQRLVEIQEIQTDLMEELAHKSANGGKEMTSGKS